MSRLTRRGFIGASLAAAAAAALNAEHGAQTYEFSERSSLGAAGMFDDESSCVLTPEQEVGPFYVADEMLRSDISESKPGVPLDLSIVLLEAGTCKALANAAVDLWHCDALGVYSGYTKMKLGPPPGGPGGPGGFEGGPPGPPPNGGPPPDDAGAPQNDVPQSGGMRGGPPAMQPTDKLTFLRGIQISDASGRVRFKTIFPGFYQGRTNHIHFKVRIGGAANATTYAAGHTAHTGQIFFPEEDCVTLMNRAPYTEHKIHRTTQAEDGVFNGQSGSVCIARIHLGNEAQTRAGVGAAIAAIVDPNATPAPVRGMGGPPRRVG